MKKKKVEWSKIICGVIIVYGMVMGIIYYIAVFCDKTVDSGLAVQCVITIIGAFVSYILYNFGLKNSRNKYGVDSDGQPFRTYTEDQEEQITYDKIREEYANVDNVNS